MYYHQRLLEDNLVDISSLPASVQNMIAEFNEQLYDLEEDEDLSNQEYRHLKAELKSLDNALAKEIKSFIDHEPREELTGTALKLAILKAFVAEGHTRPTAKDLIEAGYALKSQVKLEEQVGPYLLVKKRYEPKFSILHE